MHGYTRHQATSAQVLGIVKSLNLPRQQQKSEPPIPKQCMGKPAAPPASSFRRVQQLLKATPDTFLGTCWYLVLAGIYWYWIHIGTFVKTTPHFKGLFCSIFGVFRLILIRVPVLLPGLVPLLSSTWNLIIELLFKIECRVLHACILRTCPSPLPAWSMGAGAMGQHSRPVLLYVYFCVLVYNGIMAQWYTSLLVYLCSGKLV